MFLIYLEINSWKQLKQLEPDKMKELEEGASVIMKRGGGKQWKSHPRVYEFSSHFDESMSRILNALFETSDFLKGFEEILHGHSLILSGGESDQLPPLKVLEFLAYNITAEGQLWLDPQCREEWEPYLNLEQQGGIFHILSRKERGPLLPERQGIIHRHKKMESLLNRGLEFSENKKQNLYFSTSSLKDTLLSINYWLDLKEFNHNVLLLEAPRDHRSYLPFFHSLSEVILRWNKEDGTENSYQEMLEQIAAEHYLRIHRDCFYRDIEEAFRQYLDQFQQFCQEKRLPVICLIDRTRPWAEWAEKLLDWMIREWKPASSLLNIVIMDTLPTELEKSRTLKMKPISEKEALGLVQQAFPEQSTQKLMQDYISKRESFSGRELFAAGLLAEKGQLWEDKTQGLMELMSYLEPAQKRVLTLMSYGDEPLQGDLLEACFQYDEKDRSSISDYLDNLIHLGLIQQNRNGKYSLIWDELRRLLKKARAEDPEIRLLIQNYQLFEFELWKQEQVGDPYRLYRHLQHQGDREHWLEVLNSLISWILDNRLYDEWEVLRNLPMLSGRDGLPDLEVPLQNILNAGYMRKSLLSEEDREIENRIQEGELSLVAARGAYSDVFGLQLSRYYFSCGEPDTALNYSKESLFGFQKDGDHLGEVYANTELALAHLAQRKISMAMDYFDISRRIAQQLSNSHGLLLASSLEAVAVFLYGNLSLALRNAESLIPITQREGLHDREFFLRFIKGRILFELGNYEAASSEFFMLKSESAEKGFLPCSQTSARWEARSLIYQGRSHQAFGILSYQEDNRETLFFLSEADFMEKRYESALMKVERAIKMPSFRIYNRSERVQWIDGFQPVEGWLYSTENEENILVDQLAAFRCLLLGLRGHFNEAFAGLSRLIRSGEYPFRPYSHQYIYFLSRVTEGNAQAAERGDDQLVLLSRAIEKLQSRAGRFDDQKKKLGFLNDNYWNKCIMEEAHKRKFI